MTTWLLALNGYHLAALTCVTPIVVYALSLIRFHLAQARRERLALDEYVQEMRDAQNEAIERGLVDWERKRLDSREIA